LLATRKHQNEIRVWVPGCSTGEEAYTLAMLLLEAMPAEDIKSLKIFATDINQSSVELASEGIYSAGRLAAVPPDLVARYFEPHNENSYKVSAQLRSCVFFSCHNLLNDI